MASRDELRSAGRAVLKQLGHGSNPPRTRQLYQSTLPGLRDYTSEALFGSVWARPGLGLRERMLATLAVLVCLQRLQQLRAYLNSALNMGMEVSEIHEALIQCSLHAGFPATVNALELLRDVLETRGVRPEHPAVPEVPLEEAEARGRALYEDLFGEPFGDITDDSAAEQLRRLELTYAYGEILSRPGLALRGRAIVAVAAQLALRDDAELSRWMVAAGRTGLSWAEVEEVVLQCAYYGGIAPARRALGR